MNGQVLVVAVLAAMVVAGVHAVRKPVQKFNHGVKESALVVTQPIRHPKKDIKAVGSHVFHFIKGDR